ncbi:antibiotic biosynthesis monooxygenase [Glaciihabitans sp. UYNi722]|uniref:putative quinol monooxygenase n=1 Tax=Glaciihabitans sp. UYNi722 TaxID=3156344 RepID=UPI0033924AEA
MIKVLLDAQLKSESLEESYQGVHDTLIETREFAGAISIEVLIDQADAAHLIVLETWESAAHHDAYTAWRAGDGKPTKLLAVIATPPTTSVFAEAPEI